MEKFYNLLIDEEDNIENRAIDIGNAIMIIRSEKNNK